MAVGDQLKLFFIHQGTLPWLQNIVGFSARVSLDAGG